MGKERGIKHNTKEITVELDDNELVNIIILQTVKHQDIQVMNVYCRIHKICLSCVVQKQAY